MKISHPLILKNTSALVVSVLFFSFHSYVYAPLNGTALTTENNQETVLAWAQEFVNNPSSLMELIAEYADTTPQLDNPTREILIQLWQTLNQGKLSAEDVQKNIVTLQILYNFQKKQQLSLTMTWAQQINSATLQQLITEYTTQNNQQIDNQTKDNLNQLSLTLNQGSLSTHNAQQNLTALQTLFKFQQQQVILWVEQQKFANDASSLRELLEECANSNRGPDAQTRAVLNQLWQTLNQGKLSAEDVQQNINALQILYNFEQQQQAIITWAQDLGLDDLWQLINLYFQKNPQMSTQTQNNLLAPLVASVQEALKQGGNWSVQNTPQNVACLQILYQFQQQQPAIITWAQQLGEDGLTQLINFYFQNNPRMNTQTRYYLNQLSRLLNQGKFSAEDMQQQNINALQILYQFQQQQQLSLTMTWAQQINSATLQQLITEYTTQNNQQIDSQTKDNLNQLSLTLKQGSLSAQNAQQNSTALQTLFKFQQQQVILLVEQQKFANDPSSLMELIREYANTRPLDAQTLAVLNQLWRALNQGKLSAEDVQQNIIALQILYNFEQQQTPTGPQLLQQLPPPPPVMNIVNAGSDDQTITLIEPDIELLNIVNSGNNTIRVTCPLPPTLKLITLNTSGSSNIIIQYPIPAAVKVESVTSGSSKNIFTQQQ